MTNGWFNIIVDKKRKELTDAWWALMTIRIPKVTPNDGPNRRMRRIKK